MDWLAWWGYTAWYAAQRVKWQKQGTMILASQKLALLVFKLPLGLGKDFRLPISVNQIRQPENAVARWATDGFFA